MKHTESMLIEADFNVAEGLMTMMSLANSFDETGQPDLAKKIRIAIAKIQAGFLVVRSEDGDKNVY